MSEQAGRQNLARITFPWFGQLLEIRRKPQSFHRLARQPFRLAVRLHRPFLDPSYFACGIAVTIHEQLGIRPRFLGLGEELDAFAMFHRESFVKDIL